MTSKSSITPELLDQLLANYEKPEDLTGEDGLFKQLKKALIERALGAELTEHLGYEKGDPAGRGSGNSRNGSSAKTVLTEDGEIEIAVPRDRAGSFEPQLIAKGQTRFDGFDDKILSLYARGMTVREIQGHLAELYGTEVSPDLISRVTDAVLDEVREWQNRPLDPVYPVVFFDALRVKIRDEGLVKNKAVYVALALNPDGEKDVLGLWIEQSEGAKFWLKVVNELKARGVNDILIAVVDGLKGFPEAITSVFPETVVQTCIVHLIRNSLGIRLLEGPQGDPARHQGDLPGRERRAGPPPARGVRGRMGQALSRHRPDLAARLGACRPVLRLRPCHPQDDLHHQRGRGAEPIAAQDHQDARQLPQRRCRLEAALPRHQKCRHALAPRHRMDGRHGPVCHSVRCAFPGIGAMSSAASIRLQRIATSMAINRQTRWPERSRTASPVKAGLRPPPPAAKGLDRARRPALVGHRDFDGGFRLLPQPLSSTVTEASYTKYLTLPPDPLDAGVGDITAATAMVRTLQWVAFGGVWCSVMSTTCPIFSAVNGLRRGGRVASFKRPSTPLPT